MLAKLLALAWQPHWMSLAYGEKGGWVEGRSEKWNYT